MEVEKYLISVPKGGIEVLKCVCSILQVWRILGSELWTFLWKTKQNVLVRAGRTTQPVVTMVIDAD